MTCDAAVLELGQGPQGLAAQAQRVVARGDQLGQPASSVVDAAAWSAPPPRRPGPELGLPLAAAISCPGPGWA